MGQGAFYSERHENFNIVYDCGTEWKNRANKTFDKVIIQSFNKNETVDILFISHFDYDHVSKINILKKHVKNISTVVLPLLRDDEKIFLTNIYRILGYNISTLINNPEHYFGEETNIIYVEPNNDGESIITDNSPIQNIDDIKKSKDHKAIIKSGSKLTLKGSSNWVLIPFNYENKTRNIQLTGLLENERIDVDKLKEDSNYTLDKIINDVKLSKRNGGKIFKKVYEHLDGNINTNSMLLYSGPLQSCKDEKRCYAGYFTSHYLSFFHDFHYYLYGVACVYSGDSDFNLVNIRSVFRGFWDYVGTIQIPHHGDIKSFNIKTLKHRTYCCPISVGMQNSYGHPSSTVIAEILSEESHPVLVTENLQSMFIEIIK